MEPTVLDDRTQVFLGKKYFKNGRGYYRRSRAFIHRDVWAQANGPIPPKHHIHHINGDPTDNRVANLRAIPAGEHMRGHWTPEMRAASGKRLRENKEAHHMPRPARC